MGAGGAVDEDVREGIQSLLAIRHDVARKSRIVGADEFVASQEIYSNACIPFEHDEGDIHPLTLAAYDGDAFAKAIKLTTNYLLTAPYMHSANQMSYMHSA
ncbi:hypothetical protein AB1Y20_005005 [Prymnesium parvum]|uniref:Uncharacterized protein n=1 Tax=Prymnesium parvum TaxID=97485 RepID=A0AB34J618_PRYPA